MLSRWSVAPQQTPSGCTGEYCAHVAVQHNVHVVCSSVAHIAPLITKQFSAGPNLIQCPRIPSTRSASVPVPRYPTSKSDHAFLGRPSAVPTLLQVSLYPWQISGHNSNSVRFSPGTAQSRFSIVHHCNTSVPAAASIGHAPRLYRRATYAATSGPVPHQFVNPTAPLQDMKHSNRVQASVSNHDAWTESQQSLVLMDWCSPQGTLSNGCFANSRSACM